MVPVTEIQELASLPIAGAALYLMYRLTSNHINHSVQAVERLTEAVSEQARESREFRHWFQGWISRGEKNGG